MDKGLNRLDVIKKWDFFLKKEQICGVSHVLMDHLSEINNPVSYLISLGFTLQNEMETIINDKIINWQENKIHKMVFEEIDGRLEQILFFFRDNCQNISDKDMMLTQVHTKLQDGVILKMIPYHTDQSVISKVELDNGFHGFVKIMSNNVQTNVQGLPELLSHFVDRVLGFHRTPVLVKRKIFVKEYTCNIPMNPNSKERCPAKNTSLLLEGMNDYHAKLTMKCSNYIHFDEQRKVYYIEAIIIAEVKQFNKNYENSVDFFRPLESEVGLFYSFNLTYHQLLKKGHFISLQRLRDASDLHISDFILVNSDRHFRNWFQSGLRLVNLDNGMNFLPIIKLKEFFTHMPGCMPVFCYKTVNKSDWYKQNNFCRFNPDTITRLMAVGPDQPEDARLGARFWRLIKNDTWPFDFQKVLPLTKAESLDNRVKLVLDLHEKCLDTYGKSIYI